MRIILAQPRGYCAGVVRAIEIVELALQKYGPPVYVRHEIVHNRRVLLDLRSKGAVFVDELSQVPDGGITIFSAHGVSRKVTDEAGLRSLPVIDATCPLVAKVHREGRRYAAEGRCVVVIGHRNHPEIKGTMGQIPGSTHLVSTVEDVGRLQVEDPDRLAYVTQTTLSVDDTAEVIEALKRRFPTIKGPDLRDICYATQNRQTAIRQLAEHVDLILVVGSQNSSNSNRLRDIGASLGVPCHLIEDADCLEPCWLAGVRAVGVTAGASAPEVLVREVTARLRQLGGSETELLDGIQEAVSFKLPPELRPAPG